MKNVPMAVPTKYIDECGSATYSSSQGVRAQ